MLFQSYIFYPAVLSAVSAGLLGAKAPEDFAALADCLFLWFYGASESVLSVAAAGQYCMELCFFSRHRAWHWACYRACFRECYGARSMDGT